MKRHSSLNHIYRLVWSQFHNTWVTVAENVKGRGKSVSARKLIAAALALTLSTFLTPLAQAGPTGGKISAGSGSIAQASVNTTITQQSQNLAINWQGFSIAANEAVRFNQPNATAIALNRVLGQNSSQIFGSLSANGQVFVLNPNGVLFGGSAQVNVGGLVASTLNISDADFMAGKHSFSGTTGSVVNQGTLTAAQNGYIALLAPEVRNEGVISATLGTALLAAGDKVTLTLNNGSLLAYSIDQGSLKALADNNQLIQADGGQVFMSAKAANSLANAVVNNTGIIEARTIQNHNGTIKLMGDMTAGTVNVGGTLDASAPSGGDGGFIETSAAKVTVKEGVQITTAAPQGKTGQWLIDPADITIAASGGNVTGEAISTALQTTNVTLDATAGSCTGVTCTASGVTNGDIFVNDNILVTGGSANTSLILTASNDIIVDTGKSISRTGDYSLDMSNVTAGRAIVLGYNSSINTNNGSLVLIAGAGDTGAITQNPGATINVGIGGISLNADTLTLKGSPGSIYSGWAVSLTPKTPGRPILIDQTIADETGKFGLNQAELNVFNTMPAELSIGSDTYTGGITIGSTVANTHGNGITFNNTVRMYQEYVGGSGLITINKPVTSTNGALYFYATDTILNASLTGSIAVLLGYSTNKVTVSGGDVTVNGPIVRFYGEVAHGINPFTVNATTLDLGYLGTGGNWTGTGARTIQPYIATDPISLTSTQLGYLTNDTPSFITIGRSDGTGSISLGAFTSNAPLTLRGGAISQTGAWTLNSTASFSSGANDITLINSGNDFVGAVTVVSGKTVRLTDANSLLFGGTSSVSGNLTLTAPTTFTQASDATITATNNQIIISADTIALNGAANSINGQWVTLRPYTLSRPMVIGADGAASDFSLNTTELATLNSANVYLGHPSSTGGLTISNPFTLNSNLALYQAAAGSITVNATPTVSGSLVFSAAAPGAPVALNASVTGAGGVNLNGPVTVGADNLVVDAGTGLAYFANPVAHGTNNFTVTADLVWLADNWTGTGARVLQPTTTNHIGLADGSGFFSLDASELGYLNNGTPSSVTIGRADGAGTINGGAFSFDDPLVLRGGAITQSGAWTLSNTVSLQSGSNDITLTQAGNDFGGVVTVVSGKDVSLRDSNAMAMGASNISGNLTVQTGGALTQTGALVVTGTTTLTAGANDVTLTQAGNDFVGAVTVVSGANVAIKDANSITLGAISNTGNLTVEALGGDLTIGGNISKTSGTDATATFKATGAVIQNAATSISSTANKLNTVLWADSDSNHDGYIALYGTINTNGGGVWIGGGSGTATWNGLTVGDGSAWGNGTLVNGIYRYNGISLYDGSSISTGAGNVKLSGATAQPGDYPIGVEIEFAGNGSASITTGSGNIDILGTSTGTATGGAYGTLVQKGAVVASTGGGNVTIQGSGGGGTGANSDGVAIFGAVLADRGAINITGTKGSIGNDISIVTTGTVGYKAGTSVTASNSNISVTANTLSVAGTLQSSGTLAIAPRTANTSIGIAGGTGTLKVPASAFSTNFTNGFSGITIGSANAGDITVGSTALTYNDPLTLKTAGNITLNSNASMTGTAGQTADLTLWADADAVGGGAILLENGSAIKSNGGTITLSGGNALATGYAQGRSVDNYGNGILIYGATLDSAGGDITLRGKGAGTAQPSADIGGGGNRAMGIYFVKGTVDSGTGKILLDGVGTAAVDASASAHGIQISASSQPATLTSANTSSDAITLNGNAATATHGAGASNEDAYGVFLSNPAVVSATGAGGGIVVNATGTSDATMSYGSGFRSGSGSSMMALGPINITAIGTGGNQHEDVWLNGGIIGSAESSGGITVNMNTLYQTIGGTQQFKNASTITIQPRTANTTIGIAGGAGTLQIPASAFSNFTNGFSGITIGSATAGDITVGGTLSYNDPLTLKTSGNITVNSGASLTGNNNALVLNADADTNGGGITINSGSAINTGGGAIVMGGGTCTTTSCSAAAISTGAAGDKGINIVGTSGSRVSINSGDGAIWMWGRGPANGGSGFGADYATIDSGAAGSVYIKGDGWYVATDQGNGNGLLLSNSTVRGGNGGMTLIGNASTNNPSNAQWSVPIQFTNSSTAYTTNAGLLAATANVNQNWGHNDYMVFDATSGLGGSLQNGNIQLAYSGTSTSSVYVPNITIPTGNLTVTSHRGIAAGNTQTIAGTTTIDGGGVGFDIDLASAGTFNTGTLTVSNARNLSVLDTDTLTLGAINTAATINIATATGNLTVSQNITTTDATANAISLNAGKNTSAGTSSGGDIIISGSPTISTGEGGRATFYTGSVSGSTGLTALIGSGSGKFRYNSDEVTGTANFATPLVAGTNAIYREQPTLTVTADDKAVTYGTAPVLASSIGASLNGDTNAQIFSGSVNVAAGGATSPSGNYTAVSHTLTPSGLTSLLGYALSYTNGTLAVNKADLNVTGLTVSGKVYNANQTALLGGSAAVSKLGSDDVTLGGSATGTFASKDVGTRAVTVTGNTISGNDSGNYTLVQQTGLSAKITPKALAGSVAAGSSAYGEALTPGAASLTGVLTNDIVTPATVAVNTMGNTNTSGNLKAGSYTNIESVSSILTGADAGNYSFAGATGNYTVTGASVTGITAAPTSIAEGEISPAVVQAITALPGGADLLPAYSAAVMATSTSFNLVAPPVALSNLQYMYINTTTPSNQSGNIEPADNGVAAPTKDQGKTQRDSFYARLLDAAIQFSGTVLIKNGGIKLPSDVMISPRSEIEFRSNGSDE